MIACPKCTSTKSRVRELKSKPGFNRRYRICADCGHAYVTHEHIVIYEGKLKPTQQLSRTKTLYEIAQ